MRARLARVLFAAALIATPSIASSAVITFEPGAGTILSSGINTPAGLEILNYLEAGMRVDPDAHFHVLQVPNTAATQFAGDNSFVMLFLQNGGTFNLQQITVLPQSPMTFGNAIFTSSLGAVVSVGPGTFNFPAVGWTGITSFRWTVETPTPGERSNSIDNVTFDVAQVPEPSLLVLLGIGGLAVGRRLQTLFR